MLPLRVVILALAVLAATPVARAGGSVGLGTTFQVTFTDPLDTLDNLWLLYDQGDLNVAYRLPGSAAAGTTTVLDLAIPSALPTPLPGQPAFGILATYGGGAGIYAAFDPAAAAAMAGQPLAVAVPSFPCSEAQLIVAAAGHAGCLGFDAGTTVLVFGAGAYYQGNASGPASGSGQLAPWYPGGGSAQLVRFSDGVLAGAVSLAVAGEVPEPASGLLAAGALAGLGLLRGTRARRR